MAGTPAKILVTGADGQLGAELARHFASTHSVVGFGRVALDITDRDHTNAVFDRERPNIVFHCAAWTDVDGCERNIEKAMLVNGHGTEILTEACGANGSLMVYFSTDYVFDGAKSHPYVEDDAPNPLSAYGKSKLAGEEAVRSALSDHIIVRTSWVYGACGRNFVNTMLKLGAEQITHRDVGSSISPIRVVNDQVGCPTWTQDIAAQIRALLQKRLRGTLHVASGGAVSWYEFAREIFEVLEMPVQLEPVTTEALARPAPRPRYSVMANQRLIEAGCNIMPHYHESLCAFLEPNRRTML